MLNLKTWSIDVPAHGQLSLVLLIAMLAILSGCASTPHEILTAQALNSQGIAASDSQKAKRYFQQATVADPSFGPAFANLGIVYLNEGDYYHAALVFDRAVTLMPQDPSPHIYLGLVYENAGRLSEAAEQHTQALEIAPNDLEAVQALARVRVRLNQLDDETILLLKRILTDGTNEKWRLWAQQELAK